MEQWKEIRKPLDVEADIPLKNEAPEEVKEKYAARCKSEFVAWGVQAGVLSGCIRSGRSIQIESEIVEIIELCVMEPAKGSGYVSLEAKSQDGSYTEVIASARYSQKSLSWLKELQFELIKTFNLRENYQYHGKDA
jgi:hypothetical protein